MYNRHFTAFSQLHPYHQCTAFRAGWWFTAMRGTSRRLLVSHSAFWCLKTAWFFPTDLAFKQTGQGKPVPWLRSPFPLRQLTTPLANDHLVPAAPSLSQGAQRESWPIYWPTFSVLQWVVKLLGWLRTGAPRTSENKSSWNTFPSKAILEWVMCHVDDISSCAMLMVHLMCHVDGWWLSQCWVLCLHPSWWYTKMVGSNLYLSHLTGSLPLGFSCQTYSVEPQQVSFQCLFHTFPFQMESLEGPDIRWVF